MTTDFGLVPDATQREAHEFAPQGARNRLPQRGLPYPWGAHKTENRPLHLLLELAHAEVFEDALLDLLQTVVVFVEYPPRLVQVEMVGSRDAPGQLHQPLEIAAHHTRLSRLRMQALKPRQLLAAFLGDGNRQGRLINTLPQRQQV